MSTDTQSPPAELVKSVLLARLINNKKPPSLDKLCAAVNSYISGSVTKDSLPLLRQELESAGLLVVGKLKLTERGEREVLRFLGEQEPPKPQQRHHRIKRAVLANKLGMTVERLKKLDKEKLAALIIKQQHNLPPGSGTTLNSVLEALTCKLLGFPDAVKLNDLIAQKLGQVHGCLYNSNTVKSSGVATLLGIGQLTKESLIKSLMSKSSPTAPERQPLELEEFDLDVFVGTVLKAAREVRSGRVREDVVFINHVWNDLKSDSPFRTMGLHTFKQRLIEANREQKIRLIRADFPMYLNAKDVEESACEDTGSYFHFIQLSQNGN